MAQTAQAANLPALPPGWHYNEAGQPVQASVASPAGRRALEAQATNILGGAFRAPGRPAASVMTPAGVAVINAARARGEDIIANGLPPRRGPGRPSNAERMANAQAVASQQTISAADAEALRQQIATMAATIETLQNVNKTLNEKIARRADRNQRTLSQIIEGAENGLAADDWRLPYQAQFTSLRSFDFARNGVIQLHEDPDVVCMLAIPRSDDVGGGGSKARNGGSIAVHSAARELKEGDELTYDGPPTYITADELATVWAEDQDPADMFRESIGM